MKPNLLVLDEPTNHLDLESREALGEMLREYDGTLLLISHDRYLLDQATNRTLEVADGKVTLFDGPYGQYRASQIAKPTHAANSSRSAAALKNGSGTRAKGNAGASNVAEMPEQRQEFAITIPAGMNAHQLSKERQRAKNQVGASEKKIETLESRLKEIEASLSHPLPGDNMVSLSQEHGGVQVALEEAMTAWERAVGYAEALEPK